MEKVEVFLTTTQKRNFEQGKSFQLSNKQLETKSGKHHVEIHLSGQHYHKLLRNVKENKGFRFTPEIVLGGSLLGSLGNIAKKVGKFVTHHVSKDVVKAGLNTLAMGASSLLGHPELGALATQGINMGVDSAYNHNDKNMSMRDHAINTANDIGNHYGNQAYNYGHEYAQDNHPDMYRMYQMGHQIHSDYNGYGRGLKKTKKETGGKLKKGSQEMKEKMARLRAMKKNGGNILSDINKAFNPKQNGVANAFNQVKDVVQPYIRPAITQGLVGGINMMTGVPVGSIAQPGISYGVNTALDKLNIGIGLRGRGKRTYPRYGGLVDGIPTPILTQRAHDMINTMGLVTHRYTKNGLPNMGGSFLALGGGL